MNESIVKAILDEISQTSSISRTEDMFKKRVELIGKYEDTYAEELREALRKYNKGIGCFLNYTFCDGFECGDENCLYGTYYNALYNMNCHVHQRALGVRESVRRINR